jgi:hypothetical protein
MNKPQHKNRKKQLPHLQQTCRIIQINFDGCHRKYALLIILISWGFFFWNPFVNLTHTHTHTETTPDTAPAAHEYVKE